MIDMKRTCLMFCLMLVFIWSCSNDSGTALNPGTGSPTNDWAIPVNEVRDGGPGKDGIPSVDRPNFSNVESINFLNPNDLVMAIKVGEEVRVYPHPILDWHEIVNDEFGADLSVSIVYCPLTGTGMGWNRIVNGQKTTFGVSGLLYNTNIIPYDRATDSNWSQMEHACVNGPLIGTEVETVHVIETAFSTIRQMYPDARVQNTNTGFNRDYRRYPYGDYRTNNNSLIFPVSNDDSRLPRKERVLAVFIDAKAKAYSFDSFSAQTVNVVQDQFMGTNLVVLGSQELNFLTAYNATLPDGTQGNFEAVQDALPVVMQDQNGNRYNLFGEIVEGPLAGEQLTEELNYIGYWFSFAAFNPDIELF